MNDLYAEGKGGPTAESFYFRLSGSNLYYTSNDKDMVVQGAISLKNLESIEDEGEADLYCMILRDKEEDDWELCAESPDELKKWNCAIKKAAFGFICPDGTTLPEYDVPEAKEITRQPIYLVATPSPYCNENKNYENNGNDWECLCKEGREQSPININNKLCDKKSTYLHLNASALFEWIPIQPELWHMVYEDYTIKIKCNSKNEKKVDCKTINFGNVIDVDYNKYQGQEIHFKTPSDHTFDLQQMDMEIQCVFYPTTQDAFMNKLILSFLVKNTPGGINDFMKNIDVVNLPSKVVPEAPLKAY